MTKLYFIIFLIFLIGLGSVSSFTFGIEETSGEDGGFIIAEFQTKEFSFLDVLQPQAIIPPFVNAGTTISFKGELRKVTDFTGFLFGEPDKLIIRIYKFDSTKSNFLGERVNTFTITIPESARQSISNPLTTSLIFDAQMTVPPQTGKYRYEAEPRFGNFRETAIELDFDTFTVLASDVPDICNLPSTETTFQDITGGKLKIITLTQESGSSCTVSTTKTYNSICDTGYRAIGSGASSSCELIPVTPPEDIPPEETEGCSNTEVCCQNDIVIGGVGDDIETKTIFECIAPNDCKLQLFGKLNPIVVANQECGGATGGTTQICGDSTIQSPETCDDGNKVSGDGCSSVCKIEGNGDEVEGLCSKPNGAECTLENIAGRDDTQPSNECKSGICVDIAGVGGRCGTKTQVSSGVVVEPHPTCIEIGTAKEPFDLAQLRPCNWGEQIVSGNGCLVGWAIVIFVLFVLFFRPK